MKRIIAIIMTVCLVLCVAACGESSEKKTADTTSAKTVKDVKIEDKHKGKFRVGYGREIIMPDDSVPLAGYGNTSKRLSSGYLDELTISCTAVSDEKDNTVLLFAVDLIGISDKNIAVWSEIITKATGIKQANIIFNCSHTHSAPDTTNTVIGTIPAFNTKVSEQALNAAIKALNNRFPAKMYYSEIQTSGLNFVRHYFGDDGTCIGDNHNDTDYTGTIVKHTTESDHTLFVVKFDREGDKDVLYTNFRAHPTMTGGGSQPDISADWVGQFRLNMEKDLDCYCSYYQGGAGNQNPKSRIASETAATNHKDHGRLLANYGIEATKNMKEIKTGEIKTLRQEFEGKVNHTEDSKIAQAQIVSNYWKDTNDSTNTKRLAKTYGIASQYHADAILTKSKMNLTSKFQIYAVVIGDLALTFVPFEQFDTNSRFVIDNSPYEYTIAMGYSNGKNGYIPSAYGYEYGCYESDTGKYKPGTGEEIADNLLDMLKKIKG